MKSESWKVKPDAGRFTTKDTKDTRNPERRIKHQGTKDIKKPESGEFTYFPKALEFESGP